LDPVRTSRPEPFVTKPPVPVIADARVEVPINPVERRFAPRAIVPPVPEIEPIETSLPFRSNVPPFTIRAVPVVSAFVDPTFKVPAFTVADVKVPAPEIVQVPAWLFCRFWMPDTAARLRLEVPAP